MYKYILKPILFKLDPECVHDHVVYLGKMLGKFSLTRKITSSIFTYKNKILEQDILGIHFENPLGLSAGFDKNAELTDILPSVGFGFAEVGSITGEYCAGNPVPRLWRLKKSKSLVVYYGLKNDGAEIISKRLSRKKLAIPFGMSVAMTNCQENLNIENAILDFEKAFTIMRNVGSYVTINISCPNTLGGQPFVEPANLELLLSRLDKIQRDKPVFIKLSPDLSNDQIDALLDVLKIHQIDGIICVNLTKKRKNAHIVDDLVPEKGGLSGKVVQELSDALLSYIYKRDGDRFVLIGSGGIFTAEDAYKKIRLGASLLQIMTGMIFEGPSVIGKINRELADLLVRDGFKNVSEAIGVDHRAN